jgi:hypothetical protein
VDSKQKATLADGSISETQLQKFNCINSIFKNTCGPQPPGSPARAGVVARAGVEVPSAALEDIRLETLQGTLGKEPQPKHKG